MALCDYLIDSNITGYDCTKPMVKGADSVGVILNRKYIQSWSQTNFRVTINICGNNNFKLVQGGKMPFNGTQQEMVEGTHQNTITNTLQLVILKHDADTAFATLDVLVHGEFVVILANKNGTFQVFGLETGLHCTGAVRELYSDDTLAGWSVTMTEEGATLGNLFVSATDFYHLLNDQLSPCPQPIG